METNNIVLTVGGMKRNFYTSKLTTKTIHAVKDGYITFCGVDFEKSEVLGVAEKREFKTINCKRCLKKII